MKDQHPSTCATVLIRAFSSRYWEVIVFGPGSAHSEVIETRLSAEIGELVIQDKSEAAVRLLGIYLSERCELHQGLSQLPVAEPDIYVDHGLTGTNRVRPGLREAMAAVRGWGHSGGD